MSREQIEQMRREKDAFFRADPNSPLLPSQQEKFTHLVYYDYTPDLDLTVTVQPFATQNTLPIQTTTGDVRHYKRYGEFTFTVEGQEARLTIYATPHGFFLPFVDSGAGTETYPAGRYLEPEFVGGDRFHVDFNQAYNPFCAYSEDFSCPITPAENRLTVAIRAGEKIPADH